MRIPRRSLGFRYRSHLESSMEGIRRGVIEVLRGARLAKAVRRDARPEVEIALREALANAVFHGNGGSEEKRVFLRAYGAPKWGLLIAVRDEGPGFEPEEVPDPREGNRLELTHGRGVFLMRELMDEVDYRKAGREVVLYKKGSRTRRPTSGRTEPAS